MGPSDGQMSKCYTATEEKLAKLSLEGYRCIAAKRRSEVMLFSRYRKVLNKRFPGITTALTSLEGDFALDGELVALDSQGRSLFQMLQAIPSQSLPIYFFHAARTCGLG
jgi:bifunctional non-homologous end joining protein LigD